MSAYHNLKEKHDHLQKRTWELFEEGMKREGQLATAVGNAWKAFEKIQEVDDLDIVQNMAREAEHYMLKVLKEVKLDDHYKVLPSITP